MVRLGKLKDKEQVLQIYEDAKNKFALDGTYQWEKDYPSEKEFINDINNNKFFVYEENKIILGIITIMYSVDHNYDQIDGAWLNNKPYASIHRIATKKTSYHQGIGQRLYEYAEKIVKADGVNNIRIDTYRLNKDMRSLLIRNGYSECGKIFLLRSNVRDHERIAYQKII